MKKDFTSSIIKNKLKYNSYFDKTLKDFIVTLLKFYAIVILSLGFAYPWALCMKLQATDHHTVVCGKRMKFIGNPKELLAH